MLSITSGACSKGFGYMKNRWMRCSKVSRQAKCTITPFFSYLLILLGLLIAPAHAFNLVHDNGVLKWSDQDAVSINVHRADGSYVLSLPGNATEWQATVSGEYFIVAATNESWENWEKSQTVSVSTPATTVDLKLQVSADGTSLVWVSPDYPHVMNVHSGDGSYLTTVSTDAQSWSPNQSGEYFIVAATDQPWQSWEKSNLVTVALDNTAIDSIQLFASSGVLEWSVDGEFLAYNIHKADGSYVTTVSVEIQQWQPAKPGSYFIVGTNAGNWTEWTKSNVVEVNGAPDSDPVDPVIIPQTNVIPPLVTVDDPSLQSGSLELRVDGINVLQREYGVALIQDTDGDRRPEYGFLVKEPGQVCYTFVYVQSRNYDGRDINSNELNDYIRIRNIDLPANPEFDAACGTNQYWLEGRGVGALDDFGGDGKKELLVGSYIINSDLPAGTLLDPSQEESPIVTLSSGQSLYLLRTGDLNGDGLYEFGVSIDPTYAEDGSVLAYGICTIVKGGQVLPRTIGPTTITNLDLLLFQTGDANDESAFCDFKELGDINGDGFDDLAIIDENRMSIVHGSTSLMLNDESINSGYSSSLLCDYIWCIWPIGDFDNDGYDDLLVNGYSFASEDAATVERIVYGGSDGIQRSISTDSRDFPAFTAIGNINQQDLYFNRDVGDVNGDGASDLLFDIYLPRNPQSVEAFVFGSPGNRPAMIIPASLDGANGVYLSGANVPWTTQILNVDGDNTADIVSGSRYISGTYFISSSGASIPVKTWLQSDSIVVEWETPRVVRPIASYRLSWLGSELAAVDSSKTTIRIQLGESPRAGELRIEALDASGQTVAETVRYAGIPEPEFAPAAILRQGLEVTATGELVDPVPYILEGQVYSQQSAELFWNETKRFVFVWRDNEIIARTEGNSFQIDASTHGPGDYFLTIDYMGGLPVVDGKRSFLSGSLVRSNVVRIDF